MALQPGRNVNEIRERNSVCLRKAVRAEAFDLAETTFGELPRISVGEHAADEAFAKRCDGADVAERSERAPQLVGFGWRETRADDGDLHRLFLKQRHAERLLENRFQRRAGIDDGLFALAAAQVRMHHVALNRPWPHDGHFDHQIVKLLRLETRQHALLRAAFHLKNADGVGALQHFVHGRVFVRHSSQRERPAVVPLERFERPPYGGEHAEGEDVHLHDAQFIQIVFLPLYDGAVFHRGVLNGDKLVQAASRHDEPADVLRQVAREPHQHPREMQRLAQATVRRIQARFPHAIFGDTHLVPTPHRSGQRAGDVFRQPQHLTHFAHRAPRAVVHHGSG